MINKDDIEIIDVAFKKDIARVIINYKYKGIEDVVDFQLSGKGVNIYSDELNASKFEKKIERELIIEILDKAMDMQ